MDVNTDDPHRPADRSPSPDAATVTVQAEPALVPAPREPDDPSGSTAPDPADAVDTVDTVDTADTVDTGDTGDTGDETVHDRLERLARRLRHLEALLWGDAEDQRTEFGPSDPELVGLAESAESAQTLSRMLVTPQLRAGCERVIEEYRAWQCRYDQTLDVALEASRTIATTNPEQERHQDAARRFNAARSELDALEPNRRRVRNSAHHARRQLAHDQEVRERYQREISEGHRAWSTLTTRLRVRAAVAAERAEPLPIWLVDSLGVPPSSGAAGWRDLAVQLLAYRITYAVDDPHQALGDEPDSSESPRRRQWYRDLMRELRDWRNPHENREWRVVL